MAVTTTPELGLNLAIPGSGEPFSTAVVNANFEAIDSNAAAVDTEIDGIGNGTGGTLTRQRLTSPNTNNATLTSTLHGFQVGPTSGQNLIADNDSVQSRNNSAASPLVLNPAGGQVMAGDDIALGQIRPTTALVSGGTSTLNENGSFTFNNCAYVRLADAFQRNAGVYEVTFHVTNIDTVVAGQSCYINSSNGATHRATNAYRRAGFGGAGTWAFAGAASGSQGFVTPADPSPTGFVCTVRVHFAAWASERSKYEFTVITENGSGEWFTGMMMNTVAEVDNGMRFGITSGTMSGRGFVRQIGIAE